MIRKYWPVYILILFTLIASQENLLSQSDVTIRKKDFKIKGKSGANKAWKFVEEGDSYYIMGKAGYGQAKKLYQEAYLYNNENPELNYKIGICMLETNENQSALEYLLNSYRTKPEVSEDIQYFLGMASQLNHQFDDALTYYKDFQSSLSSKELKMWEGIVKKSIKECENGKEMIQNPVQVRLENLGSIINTSYDEYGTVLSPGDSIMYFTSRREHSKKSKKSEFDSKYYEAIYYAVKQNGKWASPLPLFSRKKFKENFAVTGISLDGLTIYLYKGSEGGGDIYLSEFWKGKWRTPAPMPNAINSKYKEATVALSPDGQTMYFISSHKKKTFGDGDIFKSVRNEKGKWQKPENLGAVINSEYDELSVSIHPNGKTLYFGSKGHNNMGGYDIFQSELKADGQWTTPVNMGYPINSAEDDLFYSPSKVGNKAYLSSVREDGYGGMDLYEVTISEAKADLILSTANLDFIGVPSVTKSIFFEMPEMMEVQEVVPATPESIIFTGKVLSSSNKQGLVANIELSNLKTNRSVATVKSSGDGSFKIPIEERQLYRVEVSAPGHMHLSERLDVSGEIQKNIVQRNFVLSKAEVGSKMILKNVYFQSGNAVLKKESYNELDKVYQLLAGNSALKIEISGHTDNIGSIRANKKLSTARAKACVDYLIRKGIDKSRLEYKGYGFLRPVAPNHTIEGRQQNRRVEFEIIGD